MNHGPKWYFSPPPLHEPHDPKVEGPPASGPLALAVGESIVLRAVGVAAGWRRLALPRGPVSWGAVAGGPVRLEELPDQTCRVEAIEKGETQIQVRAGAWIAYQTVVVTPSPIVGLAIVPEPADHSAGAYAYPATTASLAWMRRDDRGSSTRPGGPGAPGE